MAGTRSAAGPPAGGADVTRLRVAVEAGGDGAAVTAPAAPAAAPVELDERKRRVLRTVVTEFVATGQPVGSAHVVAVAGLDVSTATVRNDLAALEELGLVSQPHASAGRVPTDRGYRWFVDDLRAAPGLDPRRRAAIEELLGSARDVEELLSRTATVLTQLTRLVALVISPALETSRLRLVELVTLTPATALLLLVSDTGRVEKHAVELPAGTDERDLDRVRAMLADRLVGRRFAEVGTVLRALCDEAPADLRACVRAVAAEAAAAVREERVHEVYVGGQAALAGDASLDRGDLSRLLELLEERETLARLLEDAAEGDGPRVRIGEEHAQEDLRATSLVAQRYRLVADGSLGVLGPTRMDYGGALATVRAVSDQLQRTLRDLTADG
ncbi:MAG: heat-inducible transcription repressor HrcA [Actinomycetota bacterium]